MPDVARYVLRRTGVLRLGRRVGRLAARLASRPLPPPLPPDPADPDPIGTAARLRQTARTAPPGVVRAARHLFSDARTDDAATALARILGFVAAYPADERLQVFAGRMLERSSVRAHAAIGWQGISERFPDSYVALARRVAQMSRERGAEAAHSWLLERFPALPKDRAGLVCYAAGFSQLNEYDRADPAYEALVRCEPPSEDAYIQYARSLERRGEYDLAARLLERGRTVLGAGAQRIEAARRLGAERTDAIARTFPELVPGRGAMRDVLALLLTEAGAARVAALARRTRTDSGGVLLIGGSLGAGGAERQFAITALQLSRHVGDAAGPGRLAGPIMVICQSLTAREDAAFFLDALSAAGIDVAQIAGMSPERGQAATSRVAPYRRFLAHLPARIADGILRLSDAIAERAPDVVHIWQDGMVLTAGAAALIAGVPRIVLSARTMPPVDRLGRKKPEYETLYRGLLAQPGVVLTANSTRAAARYAAWLQVPPDTVRVVRNGVEPLPRTPSAASRNLAAAFDMRSDPAAFTLGCVMRFDENKRPAAWLRVAERLRVAVPNARFVLVGDGPLLERTRAQAEDLGLAESVLFVGRSADVGFWLGRMSAFLLLSHIEGLPNVLIEAQLAGLPVVTTPAGGAAECIQAGRTGLVLPSAVTVDPEAVAACLRALAQDGPGRAAMARAAVLHARAAFSTEAMVANTLRAYTA